MPTPKEYSDDKREIFNAINCRVKFKVFMAAVVAFASIIGLAGPILWNAVVIAGENSAIFRAYEKSQSREYMALQARLERMDAKLDKVIDSIHVRNEP